MKVSDREGGSLLRRCRRGSTCWRTGTLGGAVACTLALSALLTGGALACSAFNIAAGAGVVTAKNLDWHEEIPGAVIVNPRGVDKSVLPWRGWWPDPEERPPVRWVSRFGSLTFSAWGRDFIAGGMNEEGLVVEQASLTATYPPDDGRPGVSCAQWMQYQLDSFATVEDVLVHLCDLRPDGEGWHYLVADRAGDCAVIEYVGGEPVVFRGDDLPHPVLTNTATESAQKNLPLDRAFGGEIDIASGGDSCGRFVRIAALLRDAAAVPDGDLEKLAFRVLEAVRHEVDTRRSIVWLQTEGRVVWTTRSNREPRWLRLGDLDFSEGAPALLADASAGAGDVTGLLFEWTPEANRTLVFEARRSARGDTGANTSLEARGLTVDEALELIAGHPVGR